jgi:hypothetical protein
MIRLCKYFLAVYVFACLLGFESLTAQNSNSGQIVGSVTDTSNAQIAGVTVKATNLDTGAELTAETNGDGLYDLPSVPLGNYTLTFSRSGFSTYIRKGLTLSIQTITVNATLPIGADTQQVEVTAATPLLETETTEQQLTITSQTIETAPIVGGQWLTMTELLPGVNGGGTQTASGQGIGVNGTQAYSENWLLDGGVGTLPRDVNVAANFPPLEAIQEVNMSTSNFSAQYGNGAAVFNVITKGGTNQWHGSLFEYVQNTLLEARNYFAQQRSPLHWNEYGGSVGGPIIKDKLLFNFTYQNNPSVTQTPTFYTFPTAAMRMGDFSAPGFPTVYDPTSTTVVDGQTVRTALQGNKMNPTEISAVAAAIQNYFPMPNLPGLANNYYTVLKTPASQVWYLGRIDYTISPNHRLYGSIMEIPRTNVTAAAQCPMNCNNGSELDQTSQITDSLTINASTVNEARVSVMRESDTWLPPNAGQGYPAKIGLTNAPADIFPTINVTGAVPTEIDGGVVSNLAEGTYTFSDVLTLIHGKHTINLGGEFDKDYQNYNNWGAISSGDFTFSGIATRNPSDPSSQGLGYADFLYGMPQTWSAAEYPMTGARMWLSQFFLQDNYRISSKLTMNLGLRYGIQSGWGEAHNQFGVFDETINNPATNTPGGMVFGGQDGRNKIQDNVYDQLAPRIGVAWSPTNSLAVRASYGIFDVLRAAESYTDGALGLGYNAQGYETSTDLVTPVFNLSQGEPSLVQPTAATRTADVLNGQSVTYYPLHMPIQYIQEAYLDLQQQLPKGVLLDVGYVYTKGTHLNFGRDINAVPANLLGPGDAQARRPFPNFAGISGAIFDGESNYNALQIHVEKRMSASLAFQGNYTWSKTLDTGTSSGFAQGVEAYQNAYDPRANYGLSQLDLPQVVSGSVTYKLPFGSGQRFANRGGLTNEVAGGWLVSSIVQLHSGIPFTPVMGTANLSGSLQSEGQWFPNRIGSGVEQHPTINEWFDPAAFESPAPYTFGDSRRGILFGPGWKDVDVSVEKDFALSVLDRTAVLQVRGDAFDSLNSPNFGMPNANIGTSQVGTITTANTSRNIQLGAHLRW